MGKDGSSVSSHLFAHNLDHFHFFRVALRQVDGLQLGHWLVFLIKSLLMGRFLLCFAISRWQRLLLTDRYGEFGPISVFVLFEHLQQNLIELLRVKTIKVLVVRATRDKLLLRKRIVERTLMASGCCVS